MENYVKAVLYAYPLLKTVERDYAEHIRNKAVLSYKSPMTAENLATYIAEEILHRDKLLWLRGLIENVICRLSEEEKTLLSIRYFGKVRKIKSVPVEDKKGYSERSYFRKQNRLSEKVAAMLRASGLTEEKFRLELSQIEIFDKIGRCVAKGLDEKITADERRWLQK